MHHEQEEGWKVQWNLYYDKERNDISNSTGNHYHAAQTCTGGEEILENLLDSIGEGKYRGE